MQLSLLFNLPGEAICPYYETGIEYPPNLKHYNHLHLKLQEKN